MEQENTRDGYLDTAKFVLIAAIVLVHVSSILNDYYGGSVALHYYVTRVGSFFHIPSFVLLTGYFSKNINWKKYFHSSIRFIETYLLIQILFAAYYYELIWELVLFKPYWVSWYLVGLVLWRGLLLLLKQINNKNVEIKIAIVLSLVFVFYAFGSPLLIKMLLPKILFYTPFFLFGYYLTTEQFQKFKSVKTNKKVLVLASTFVVAILLLFYLMPDMLMSLSNEEKSHLKIRDANPDLYRFISYVLMSMMVACFFILLPSKPPKMLAKYGQRTMIIFIYHMFVVFALTRLFEQITSVFAIDLIIYTLLTLGVTMLMSNYKIFYKLMNPISSSYEYLAKRLRK